MDEREGAQNAAAAISPPDHPFRPCCSVVPSGILVAALIGNHYEDRPSRNRLVTASQMREGPTDPIFISQPASLGGGVFVILLGECNAPPDPRQQCQRCCQLRCDPSVDVLLCDDLAVDERTGAPRDLCGQFDALHP